MASRAPSIQNQQTFPSSKDEATICLKFSGRSESKQVILNGWTGKLPLTFVGLKEALKIRDFSDGRLQPTDLNIINGAIKLKELATKTGAQYSEMPYPAIVYILAKKALDIIVKGNELLVFGDLVVGDDTGICRLNVCNDAIYTFYQQVRVGDKVVLGAGKIGEGSQLKPADFGWNGEVDYLLNLDLKVNQYNCRRIFKLNTSSSRIFPPCFTDARQIFSVSNLSKPSLRECTAIQGKPQEYHFDVIGIISHVGRMERYREFGKKIYLEDGKSESVPFFNTFRWIELVDRYSVSVLPLQLYISQDLWPLQPMIIPGSLTIITNVQRVCDDFMYPRLVTSRFSQVFINNEILQYSKLVPARMRQIVTEVIGTSDNISKLNATSSTWSAGGSYGTPFEFGEKFIEFANKLRPLSPDEPNVSLRHMFPPGIDELRLRRRESKRLAFKGFIVKYAKIHSNGQDVMVQNTNPNLRDECGQSYEAFSSTDFCFPHKNWFMFSRKLPLPSVSTSVRRGHSQSRQSPRKVQKDEGVGAYEELSSAFKKYCDPLCMPTTGEVADLRDLPALDCYPCFIILIVNRDAHPYEKYFCVWKASRFRTFEEMESKLATSINSKWVYFMVDVHYVEDSPQKVLEIILQDFVVAQE